MSAERIASHLLIAIDPGKRVCGVSVWGCESHQTQLLHACSIRPGGNLLNLPSQVEDLWIEHVDGFDQAAPQFVFEVPKYYAKKRATFRGVDALFDVLDAFQKYGILVKDYVYPNQWKGNIPKNVHRRRIEKALSKSEHKCVDPAGTHDMWDAIGIGLYATGRTGRAGIPAN
jgi:Holliday junction resolvasome RuvABC endonuclease subunit